MHQMYKHLSRSVFHAGLTALRHVLRTSTESQVKAKSVLGKSGRNVSWREYSDIHEGKLIITALLNVYLHVRGKPPAHNADKFDSACYLKRRDDMQGIFDEAVGIARNAEVAVAELATKGQ
jgi:hypothetical protein